MIDNGIVTAVGAHAIATLPITMGEESIECNEGKLITKNGGYSPVKQSENGDLARNDSQKKIGELIALGKRGWAPVITLLL